MIYIYGLKCPLLGVIRYVGKAEKPRIRLSRHLHAAVRGEYDHHTARWLRKLVSNGLRPEIIILHTVRASERWQDVEREFIKSAKDRGWKLTNSTAGGEGLDYIDPVAKAAYILNLRAANKRVWNTPEGKIKSSERSLKAWADPDITVRRIASMKLAQSRPEIREKTLASLARIRDDPDALARKHQSIRKSWTDLEVRARRSAALNREKMSASAKARWADPEERQKLLTVRSTAEYRALLSLKAKLRATPEYRAMMAAKTREAWKIRRIATLSSLPSRRNAGREPGASLLPALSFFRITKCLKSSR